MALTDRQQTEYLVTGGVRCPFCNAENIMSHEIEYEGVIIKQRVRCDQCENQWLDIFQLNDIEEIDP